jgi:uncharacterized membrane protein
MDRSTLRLLVTLSLAAGLFFRFYNLETKVYWNDEVWTSLWLSGHTNSELIETIFDGAERTALDFVKYQRVNPDRGWLHSISALATDDPKQTPVYYGLLRLWAEWLGDTVAILRSFSALISVLAFLAFYWLCRQLFTESRIRLIAVALLAVSPIHVLYAQELRPYSLWIVLILVSSAALTRAMRLSTWRSWSLYAATLLLTFYTHAMSVLVALGHAAFIAAYSLESVKGARSRLLISYGLSSLAAVAAFVPWAVLIFLQLQRLTQAADWLVADKVGVFNLLGRWSVTFSAIFLDLSYDFSSAWKHWPRIPILLLIVYSIYFLWRRGPKTARLFVVTLIGTPAVALMLPDLVMGGRSISLARFLIPSWLGIQIAVAYLLAVKTDSEGRRRNLWQAITVVIILCGALSLAVSSQADTWWNKSFLSMYNPQAARTINTGTHPLVVSDGNPRNLVSLGYLLYPKVKLRLVVDPKKLQLPDHAREVFVFQPSDAMRERIQSEGYGFELLDVRARLWRLTKPSQ